MVMTVIDQGRYFVVFLHLGFDSDVNTCHASLNRRIQNLFFVTKYVLYWTHLFMTTTNLVIILRYEFNKPYFIFSRPVKGNNIAKSYSTSTVSAILELWTSFSPARSAKRGREIYQSYDFPFQSETVQFSKC